MRKTALPLASIALALLASGVGLLHAVEPAEATFAGQNGNIAHLGFDGNDYEIYTTSPATHRSHLQRYERRGTYVGKSSVAAAPSAPTGAT